MFSRFMAVFVARNREFLRDRSALLWSVFFPVMLVVGFAFIFSGDNQTLYKIGYVNHGEAGEIQLKQSVFNETRYLEFIGYGDKEEAKVTLQQHRIDLLVDFVNKEYWLNKSSPKGYVSERLLLQAEPDFVKKEIDGREIRYLDWVVPGILGMNMMFSSLFGVGYVVVRYRKNSVLKRLQATPLSSLEFVSAQLCSRIIIVMATVSIIFAGCNYFFDFYMLGNYFDLLIIAFLGAMSLISLGLLVASRSESEEFVGGLLNMSSWPMMILSGVWFSLEGSPVFIQSIANLLPLTHLVEGARSIMLKGDSLWDIKEHVFSLVGMTVVFLGVGAGFFKWGGSAR